MSKFIYDLPAGWQEETVILPTGEVVLRYGRLRKIEERHLGAEASLRDDGALFDRCNPLMVIMPINVKKQTIVSVSSLGKVTSHTVQSLLPGGGVYGDIGRYP